MTVRVIVPRRSDGGHRDRLWAFCRSYWERELGGWDIVEGHHDDGPFNRSAAINSAALGDWDVAVILDADVILDPELIAAGVARAQLTDRMTLPFHVRHLLSQQGTSAILGGHRGSWSRWVRGRDLANVSTCVIVPRRLWDEVGGFDERFVGWGGEDEAFAAACAALGGGAERLAGAAWHLHHPVSSDRTRGGRYRQTVRLAERYKATTDPVAMRRLVAEKRTDDQVVLVALTNGARDTLSKTIHSAGEMLHGPIGRRVICDDSHDTQFHRWLQSEFPAWDVVALRSGGGYSQAVASAIDVAVGSGQPWVAWLEDDFTFEAPVDLEEMQAVMVAHPELAQLSLKRQAWYEDEVAAGGIIEAKPALFAQRDGYVEHRAYWTMNPMLTRRALLADRPWPKPPYSEGRYARLLLADRAVRFGIFGEISDPPRVTHIGVDRAGDGY